MLIEVDMELLELATSERNYTVVEHVEGYGQIEMVLADVNGYGINELKSMCIEFEDKETK